MIHEKMAAGNCIGARGKVGDGFCTYRMGK